jgi:hypothetical protein
MVSSFGSLVTWDRHPEDPRRTPPISRGARIWLSNAPTTWFRSSSGRSGGGYREAVSFNRGVHFGTPEFAKYGIGSAVVNRRTILRNRRIVIRRKGAPNGWAASPCGRVSREHE